MDEETTDVAADTNAEVEEDTNISEEEDDTSDDSNEEAVALKSKLDDALKAKSDLTVRAKKAEEELKTLKAKPQDNKPNDPQLSEELKLIARGLSDEEIDQAKVIAKGKEVPLTEAIKDPLFIIFQADLKEKEKKEKAKLGASKGSGESKEESEIKSGLTREQHEKVFKEALGK